MPELNELEERYLNALAKLSAAEQHRREVSAPVAPLPRGGPIPRLSREQLDAENAAFVAWNEYVPARDAYWAAKREAEAARRCS